MAALMAFLNQYSTIIAFCFGVIVAGPLYLGVFSLMVTAKREDEWIEKEYFSVKCDDDGFKVMTH